VKDEARLNALLETMIEVVREAGALALGHFLTGCASQTKKDGSIVTIADTQAEALIISRLKSAYPNTSILGEESHASGAKPDLGDTYFCVDPIDGTRQFASGDRHWVVSLGYLEGGRPVAGVIFAPALKGRLFAGLSDFGGFEILEDGGRLAFPRQTQTPEMWRVVHGVHDRVEDVKAMLPSGQKLQITSVGSALKFGLVACGEADVFVRAGRVWDWDIAAGQAIVEAAAGAVRSHKGGSLIFGDPSADFRHPPFLATSAIIQVSIR
jgi:3'(2'), 5'-bisphosphate nucleotidase